MKRSTGRIITTHVGSLDRSDLLLEMYSKRNRGEAMDNAAFEAEVRKETIEMADKQAELGVDVPSDGEMGRFSFLGYALERLSGFERRPSTGGFGGTGGRERQKFPGFFKEFAKYPHYWQARMPGPAPTPTTAVFTGPIKYNPEQVNRDIANFKAGLQRHHFEDSFMSAQPPSEPGRTVMNEYFRTEEEFRQALADAMNQEYKAITNAGIVVQIDDPIIVYRWTIVDSTMTEYRKWAEQQVEYVNYALRGIPEDMIRYHVCWGSFSTPHTDDLPIKDALDFILKIKAQGYSIEAANVQHEHEWKVWKDHKLPAGKVLIPGVVSHKTNVIEHPELVEQRLVRYGEVVGRENVIASADCGFGGRVLHPEIAWEKLKVLAAGSKLATNVLWRK